MDELYCKIYLRPKTPQKDIRASLKRIAGGTLSFRTLQAGALIIDIFSNELSTSSTEDFVLWPAYLEIEPAGATERGVFVAAIRSLLQALRANDIDAVAACDFEDELA